QATMTNQTEAAQAPQPAAPCLKVSRRAKLVLGLVGAAGCVSLYWLPPPELPGVSEQLLRLAQPIQPLLLLLGALFLGARYAPRVGTGAPWLEALLAGRTPASRGAGSVGRVAGICALLGIAAALLPLLVWPLIAPSLPATFVAASKTHGPPFAVRLLYGGITEELLVRWGLLSWFLWLLRPRGEKLGTRPSRAATWTAAII